jgi:alcohol dehydrogenase class IV
MDALTQCLEPYVSRQANPVTDAWARTGLLRAGRGLRRAYAEPSDRSARGDMALASLMGGLALANAKLGAVHGFAGVIGGMSDAPHGAVCAALLAPVCRANLAVAGDALRARFADVAQWLTGHPTATPEQGLEWIEGTCAELGIPGLSAHGLGADRADEVVAKAARASSMKGNPVELSEEALHQVYAEAL